MSHFLQSTMFLLSKSKKFIQKFNKPLFSKQNMEKDIGKISKNAETDIVIRVDDFGGKPGVTIREFVKSDRYTGFTKAGTRISAEKFEDFKEMINAIDVSELKAMQSEKSSESSEKKQKQLDEDSEDY